jgi:hypothetical protein
MKCLVAVLACFGVAGGLTSAQAPPVGVATYQIIAVIDHPDSVQLNVAHLNNKNEVAGWYKTDMACHVPETSFVWSNGTIREISFPGAYATRVEGLDERGAVSGSFIIDPIVPDPVDGSCGRVFRQGFFMSPDGEFYTLPWAPLHSVVTSITSNGWMTGPTAPCDWRVEGGACLYGFLYRGRGEPHWIKPPGCSFTVAQDVNIRGEVVGPCRDVLSERSRGFRYKSGAYEFIDFPGATSTSVGGTNAAGDLVGLASLPAQGGEVNFVRWGNRFAAIEVMGAETVMTAMVWGINDLGMISGVFTGGDGRQRGFIAQPIR